MKELIRPADKMFLEKTRSVPFHAAGRKILFSILSKLERGRLRLKDGDLAEGVEIRAIGQPAADISEKRMKVERMFLENREYDLYPNRD